MTDTRNWQPDDAIEPSENGVSPFQRVLLGDAIRTPRPRPKTLAGLIYGHRLHTISGEPESGKTITALWLALQLIAWQRPVVLIDEEAGKEQTEDLLYAMGADPETVPKFLHYYSFVQDNWLHQRTRDYLHKELAEIGPALAIFDSSAAMMASSHVNENDPGEVRRFWNVVLGPVARERDCSVLVIDHDAKGGADTRYSRGTGDKLAVVDVAIKMAVVEPFSRDQDGRLTATITKDRLGCLWRSYAVAVTRNPLNLTWDKRKPQPRGGNGEGLAALQAALTDTPQSTNQLNDRIKAAGGFPLRRETMSRYLAELEARELAECTDTGGGRGNPALWCRTAPARPAPQGGMTWN
jgi:hypothetical protein